MLSEEKNFENSKTSSVEKSKSSSRIDEPPESVAYIHGFLDEYGLDPYEFRLYAHIVRRTGGKPEGVFFASLTKSGGICDMSVRKAQQALKVLLKANLIKQTKRQGRTDEYRVTPTKEWVSREELAKIRASATSPKPSKKIGTAAKTE